MKKLAYFFAAILALSSSFACNRQVEIDNPQPIKETLTFRAVLEQPDTKASLNSNYAVVWEPGDKIAVYNGTDWVESEALTDSDIKNDGRYATFSVSIAKSDTYYAVYPASAAPSGAVSDDVLAVTLPDVQDIPSGGCVAKNALVQVCKTTNKDNMVFKNISSLVEFKAPEDLHGYVRFEAFDAEGTALQVAGAASVNAAAPPAAVSGNAGKVIVKGNFAAEQNYFAVVYPQSVVSSFRFAFSKEDADNGTLKAFKTGSSEINLPLNGGKKFIDLGTLKWLGPLSTKADLDKWAKYADYYLEGETVKLGADIDYEGGTWTPVNGNDATGFAGCLDGQGHSIYKIIIDSSTSENCGFFADLTSKAQRTRVKNLKLGYDPAKSGPDGTSNIVGTNDENTHIGALVGLLDKSNVENVDNCINVTVTQDAEAQTGGLIGRCESTCYITNCKNFATIEGRTANSGSVYLGGLIGTLAGSNSKVVSCVNQGTVQRTAATTRGNTFLGGIIGRTGKGVKNALISKCLNKGSVKTTVNVKNKQLYIGGIISMDNSLESEEYGLIISDCSNEGSIECTSLSAASTGMGVGGIIGYSKNKTLVSNCTNLGTISKPKNHNGITSRFGGIIGWMNNAGSIIQNCTNGSVDDSSKGSVSGLVETSNTSDLIYYGGILGALESGTVTGCKNYGNISSKSTSTGICEKAGGLTGYFSGGSIVNCENYGKVSIASNSETCSAGGLIGLDAVSTANTTGTGCKVSADVSCGYSANTGAIIGLYDNSASSVFGTSESRINVSGSIVNGTILTASIYQSHLAPGISASGIASGNNTIWATFATE